MEMLDKFTSYMKLKCPGYPKTKDGSPAMNVKSNRIHFENFIADMQSKNMNSTSIQYENPENVIRENKNFDDYECCVCMNIISTNIVYLDCKHQFCVSCFSNHIRTSSHCPLCRSELPNNRPIQDKEVENIIISEFATKYPERDYKTFPEFLYDCIQKYREEDSTKYLDRIMCEVVNFGFDIASNYR